MLNDEIRTIILQQGRLKCEPTLVTPDADLFVLGLTSLSSVGIMLAVEDRYGLEFPQEMLSRDTFRSVATIAAAVERIRGV